MKFTWEALDNYTYRARVYGGWIVKCHEDIMTATNNGPLDSGYEFRVSTVFVPDVHGDWVIHK